ncbi:MAG: P-loop containing nucleoside triphosphate hydrolase protein [Monoraphidium minutum]|nr:MAG: P-loop containing nucleoside triphosphate hydrolase protein [Monoraphidium minutum]
MQQRLHQARGGAALRGAGGAPAQAAAGAWPIGAGPRAAAPRARAPAGAGPAPARAAPPAGARRDVRAAGKRGDVLLVAEALNKTHDGDRMLFQNLSFTISAGDKLAVVGPNGAGKSTLLKIIAGSTGHNGGVVSRNKGARIGYLPQARGGWRADLLLSSDDEDGAAPARAKGGKKGGRAGNGSGGGGSSMTVLQAILASDNEVVRAVQDYERALASAGDRVTPELQSAIERMDAMQAWEVDSEARRLLEAIGLPDPNAPASGLSGGQRRRLALATALLGGPDLLVLDEPTNHMDVHIIDWMARELTGNPDLAVVTVTHDRAFMEAACNRILELDGNGGAHLHNIGGEGSYEKFKEAREARRAAQASAAADARTVLRRESEWMARQPKARARIASFYDLTAKAKDVPPPDTKVDFGGGGAMARQGNKAVVMKGVNYALPNGGRQLVSDFTFEFLPGERLGIAGPNGAGKSTLLDLITGKLAPNSGLREEGETAAIGYFTQHPPPVDPSLRLVDYIRTFAEAPRPSGAAVAAAALALADPDGVTRGGGGGGGAPGGGMARQSPETLLERLGFPRKRQFQKVESLSGGERRRLHLAAVLASSPNVLVLDEPTNDLSLEVVEVLEEMLQAYRGVLLVVSHDRAFMDATTDRLLVLKGDGVVRLFDGSYTDYLQLLEDERKAAEAAAAAAPAPAPGAPAPPPAATSGKPAAAAPGKGGKRGGGGAAAAAPAPAKAKPAPKKRTLGFFEREEFERLEGEIADLEKTRDALNARLMELSAAGAALAEVEAAATALAEADAREQKLSERWLELAEIAGDLSCPLAAPQYGGNKPSYGTGPSYGAGGPSSSRIDGGRGGDDDKLAKVRDPLLAASRWIKLRSPKEKTALCGLGGVLLLLILWRTIEDHDTLFVLAEAAHFVGIGLLGWKIYSKKSVAGLSLQTQILTGLFLVVRLYCSFMMEYDIHTLLDLMTAAATAAVLFAMLATPVGNTYQADLDTVKSYFVAGLDTVKSYFVIIPCLAMAAVAHPYTSHWLPFRIMWAVCVYLEAVSVLPQLRMMQNSKVVERFTAHYVFCLGLSRFFSCAHWILQLLDGNKYLLTALGSGLWPVMVLLSEVVQTFILADFCFYYVKSYADGTGILRLPVGIV